MIRVSLEESGGFYVVEAGNGFEALKTLPTRRFDLIITDINMPDINGLELIGFVKSNPAYRDIPLVIVSTEKTEEDVKRGLALGAAGYVVKPFTKADLMAAVGKVLGGQ
jgi:two-component system chemotaxis response regulator CheY